MESIPTQNQVSSLQSFTFEDNFNQSMENVILPSGLQSLIFQNSFHREYW